MRDFKSLKFNFGRFKFWQFFPFNFCRIKFSSSLVSVFRNLNLLFLTFSSFHSIFILIGLSLVIMSWIDEIEFFLMNQSNTHSKITKSKNVNMFKVSFKSSTSLKTPNSWVRFFTSCNFIKFKSFLIILLHFIDATLIPRICLWKYHISKDSFTKVSILLCPRDVQMPQYFYWSRRNALLVAT